MDAQFIIMLGSVAANFILIVLVLIHLRKSPSGHYLFLIILSLTGWAVSNYYSNLNFSYTNLLWLNRLIFITTSISAWSFAYFAESFPKEINPDKKT